MQFIRKILLLSLIMSSFLESKTFTVTKCIDVKSSEDIYIDKKIKVADKICYFDYRGMRCHTKYIPKTIKEFKYYRLMGYYKGQKIFKRSLHQIESFPISITIFQKNIINKPSKKGRIKIESW